MVGGTGNGSGRGGLTVVGFTGFLGRSHAAIRPPRATLAGMRYSSAGRRSRKPSTPKEFKIVPLRDCPIPESLHLCDTPYKAAEYWRLSVASHPYFSPEHECFVVLFLNTRRRIRGHHLVSIGTMDSVLVHPRDAFRAAVIGNASAVLFAHNHPSGDPTPSEGDIRVTNEMVRAGQILKIQVLDHVIIGAGRHVSMREQGYIFV